jgi:hypothetical protein
LASIYSVYFLNVLVAPRQPDCRILASRRD